MKQLRTLVASVAAVAALGLGSASQAATISNFAQNLANGGLTAGGGTVSVTNVPIDYIFQVPPIGPATTVPATLNLTSAAFAMTALGGSAYAAANVAMSFTIVDGASTNLLSGTLNALITVDTATGSATFQGSGISWTSDPAVTYDVGGGPVTANLLLGKTFSMSLLNLHGMAVDNQGVLSYTSNVGVGGSSITGNFAAVPEPASLVLLGLGLAGIPGVVALRKRAARA